ncbi:TetR/AcrR family transcriptional regulator [Cryobacterium sp. TMS1-20-1]|uniref:TetR/AcrR family transcriptional regulator n=1 Tax=Cryobacterium sp. TMS1-20-1 TaxID=1259223 RepID=UPI00106D81DA|nr:TetR/AcrR family transcriptional regulator [Cryobacterium sp. TMS1-20-1]TFC78896.1 TetR/AcrR family transcriptional regulator [Cryobacterium sp. TMS1-20-1]
MAKQPAPPTRQGEITDVAARLFNEQGLAGTSMTDIADALGIKKPTLYHYVQSKAQIVGWIHEECVRAIHPSLTRYIADGLPPTETLFLVARDILALLVDKPGYLRVYFENHRDLDSAEQERIVPMRDDYFDKVKIVLRSGQESGEFRLEDVDIAALAYFGMCNWAYQWYNPQGRVSTEDLALQLWRIYIQGVSFRTDSDAERIPASYGRVVS